MTWQSWVLFGIAVLTPIVTMLVTIRNFERRIDEKLAKHEHTLYGPAGANGLNSDMKKVRERVHDLANTMQRYEAQQEIVDKIVDAFARRGNR